MVNTQWFTTRMMLGRQAFAVLLLPSQISWKSSCNTRYSKSELCPFHRDGSTRHAGSSLSYQTLEVFGLLVLLSHCPLKAATSIQAPYKAFSVCKAHKYCLYGLDLFCCYFVLRVSPATKRNNKAPQQSTASLPFLSKKPQPAPMRPAGHFCSVSRMNTACSGLCVLKPSFSSRLFPSSLLRVSCAATLHAAFALKSHLTSSTHRAVQHNPTRMQPRRACKPAPAQLAAPSRHRLATTAHLPAPSHGSCNTCPRPILPPQRPAAAAPAALALCHRRIQRHWAGAGLALLSGWLPFSAGCTAHASHSAVGRAARTRPRPLRHLRCRRYRAR